jgi:phosphoribosylaminoimidazole (AIR) synthetase
LNDDKAPPSVYSADGVNISEGDKFSAFAGEINRASYGNSPYVKVTDYSDGFYRGPRTFQFHGLPAGCQMDGGMDSIGTKVIVIDAANTHRLAINDLIEMVAMDITRYGGLPLILMNTLEARSIGKEGDQTNTACREMILGMGEAVAKLGMVSWRGETAEVGVCVGTDNNQPTVIFVWVGAGLGVYHPDKMIIGKTLAEGQVVVALQELGLGSNGISSARKALALRFGSHYHTSNDPEAIKAVRQAAEPCVLYDRFLTIANGWYSPDFQPLIKMHSVIHLSGGSIKGKFADDVLFPRQLSAVLDDLWEPPEIMANCAKWRNMPDEECYETWHGGQRALVVIDEKDFDRFAALGQAHGVNTKICGRITKEAAPAVCVLSKFTGNMLHFKAAA